MSAAESCFHCGLPIPAAVESGAQIDGSWRPMCCPGCAAVARAIVDAGLGAYYRQRTAKGPTAGRMPPDAADALAVYDHPRVQRTFVRGSGPIRSASLILEGITCAACVWLNERHLAALPGVEHVSVNYSSQRADIRWDSGRIRLSDILRAIHDIGYRAQPYDRGRRQALLDDQRRDLLRRFGVAAALGMQVMILAVALYSGAGDEGEGRYGEFFERLSLLLTVPVLVYSGQPFLRAAAADLRQRRAGMDVPVSLGIGLAFAASVWTVVSGRGEVYFDSVCMFILLLLGARLLELSARRKAADGADVIGQAVPALANRLGDARIRSVPAVELVPGDRVLVRPGETIPADGVVVEGRSGVDESLLTGESVPRTRGAGDRVIGGSINVDSPLTVTVDRVGADSVLSGIQELLDRAAAGRPTIALLADRVATWFVLGVLTLAAAVALTWWHLDPQRWLPVTVAVLVISCPCALSLATPTAIAVALGRLMRGGVLMTGERSLETLSRITDVVFDKTGTLTRGEPRLQTVTVVGSVAQAECLAIAAALERSSEHPVARAFIDAAPAAPVAEARDLCAEPGRGIVGTVGGRRYRLGSPDWVGAPETDAGAASIIVLADERGPLARFTIADSVRPEAARVIGALRRAGLRVTMLTGDREPAARAVACAVGIDTLQAGLEPAEKLAAVAAMQRAGAVVAMAGDGVNDAPVLAAADVSIAVSGAVPLAAASADVVITGRSLETLVSMLDTVRSTFRVIRQNLAWAIGYNLAAIPAAAAGLVPPWLAAAGMSLSSLVVVSNALRPYRGGSTMAGG